MKQKNILKCLKALMLLVGIITLMGMNVKAADNTVISSENWNEWQDENYWEWHTRTTTDDKAYNGNHIVIQNDVIDFYGYWMNSYKDFLYKEYKNPGKKIFNFRIDETKANYHTLDGAGFIFNAKKENNKLSGYILLFRESNVCIYRVGKIDIQAFEVTSNKTIADYGTLIKSVPKTNSTIHDLSVEATPTNIKVTEGGQELLNVNLDYSLHAGDSFGLISSYVQHACSILSKIQFSQLKMTLEDYKATVLNTDLNNKTIPGGYFEVKNENGELISEGKADEKGILNISGLKEGTYTIQQKKAPEGYILNDTTYKFKITNEGKVIDVETGKEISLIIKNKKIETNQQENNIDNSIDNTIDNSINNIINSSTNNNIQKDNTISSKPIPNAGEKIWIIGLISILAGGFSIGLLIKLKKYKIVK